MLLPAVLPGLLLDLLCLLLPSESQGLLPGLLLGLVLDLLLGRLLDLLSPAQASQRGAARRRETGSASVSVCAAAPEADVSCGASTLARKPPSPPRLPPPPPPPLLPPLSRSCGGYKKKKQSTPTGVRTQGFRVRLPPDTGDGVWTTLMAAKTIMYVQPRPSCVCSQPNHVCAANTIMYVTANSITCPHACNRERDGGRETERERERRRERMGDRMRETER